MEEYKQINTEENYNKLLNSGMFWEMHPELTGTWEVDKKLILPDVVVSFYCNHDDGEYHNDPCAEQCNFCKEVEETLQ
jgi:hypothetical protein